MTVSDLQQTLGLEVFTMPQPTLEVTGGYAGDLLSWVMGRAEQGSIWVTIMSNQNVAAVAMMADVSCVLLSEGVKPDDGLLEKAQTQGVNLLGCQESTWQIIQTIGKS